MEIVIIDSSVLITSSLFWECDVTKRKVLIKAKNIGECGTLFNLFKKYKEDLICVITKTVELEATSALESAVDSLLQENRWKIKDIMKKFSYSTLRNVMYDRSLDRMDDFIEEHSTRFPLDRAEINKIVNNEIEPFFKKVIPKTIKYIPIPRILKKMHGDVSGKIEIIEKIKDGLSSDKIIYIRGEPKQKDKRLMAETVYIRRVKGKDKVFLASFDYHFIPNPTQIDSFKSSL